MSRYACAYAKRRFAFECCVFWKWLELQIMKATAAASVVVTAFRIPSGLKREAGAFVHVLIQLHTYILVRQCGLNVRTGRTQMFVCLSIRLCAQCIDCIAKPASLLDLTHRSCNCKCTGIISVHDERWRSNVRRIVIWKLSQNHTYVQTHRAAEYRIDVSTTAQLQPVVRWSVLSLLLG